MTGPTIPFADRLHAQKYRAEGESFREAMNRVASALADNKRHYHQFKEILRDMRFLPGGRIQAAIGSTKSVTPYNCFVSGTIEDSFVAGHGSIMSRATEAAATMRMGGGIGYDFSTLRPNGAFIKKLQSRSSGPISFMEIYDAVCRCVACSGHRRGAQMGVLRVDHPDIEAFIHAKQNETRLTGFNISVAITDEFMECVRAERPFRLRFGGEVYKEVDSLALWENIMRSTWDWAEPGVLFIDTINRENNLYYCERIAASNPCGEQPLPPYGACLLGSFNLTKYVDLEVGEFDFMQLEDDVPPVVRAMDNVVDKAIYPLHEQEQEAKNKRRMGLGVTGLANALESLGLPYGSRAFVELQERILDRIAFHAYEASVDLAREKGPFPAFDTDLYCRSRHLQGRSELLSKIARHGIRNSHLTSVAPTGTISMTADNVSSGIEPVYAYSVTRAYVNPEGEPESVEIDDWGRRNGVLGKHAADVTIDEHLDVLIGAQRHVDSAVSKTCNVPADTPWEQFKSIYVRAWESGAKGCTTFQMGGRRRGVMEERRVDEGATCSTDPVSGRRECE